MKQSIHYFESIISYTIIFNSTISYKVYLATLMDHRWCPSIYRDVHLDVVEIKLELALSPRILDVVLRML